MQTIFNDINNIFKSITNKIYNETNIRNRKISIEDILLYRFKYSQINKTKQNIVSEINFNNKKVIDRTTFYRKDNNIPLKFYKYLFDSIKNFYNEKNKFKGKNGKILYLMKNIKNILYQMMKIGN
jgi:hypothetical protein